MTERRREPRTPARGEVTLILGERKILGRLLDRSSHGLRVAHDCAWLSAGQQVQFELRKAASPRLRGAAGPARGRAAATPGRGTARVIWTRIAGKQVQSGLWTEGG